MENPAISPVQIEQDIAGILVPVIGVKVDVESFAVADAQEFYVCGMEQFGSGPQPLPGQGSPGLVVDQANPIQVVRHRCELSADSLLSEPESALSRVSHGFLRRGMIIKRTHLV
jgi:hypothetical protein